MPTISCSTATTVIRHPAATRINGRRGCVSSWTVSTKETLLDPRHHHIFDLDIFFHAVMRTFAAETRFLDAAERCDLGGDQAGVDADHPGSQRLGDPPDPAEIARIEIRRQPERRIVAHCD